MDYKRTPMQAEIHSFAPGSITYSLAESFYTNFKLQDIGLSDINLSNLVLAYGDHHGKKELRELIAKEAGVTPEEVLITAGTAMALFIVNTAILKSGDRVVGEHPNFAINLEVPRLAETKIEHLEVKFEQGFKPQIADIEAALETETKLLTVATPHNPSGISLSEGELKAIVELTKKKNTYLLVDEIFREFAYDSILPVAATLGNHVISVSSLSKSFGLPGIRIGWIICRDPVLMEKFLAAKEQIVICGSVVDEEIAYQFVKKKQEFLPKIKADVEENRVALKEWFKQQEEYLEWVEPQVGVICFPRLKSTDKEKIEEFYTVLLKEYKTLVAPGHWFDMERRHFRLGYGSLSKTELSEGLECVSKALRKVFSS